MALVRDVQCTLCRVVCSNLINVINVFRFPSSYVPSSGYFTDWRAIVYPHCFESVVNCRHNAILTERQQTQQSGTTHILMGMYSLIARFMGPRWGPVGTDRTQLGPMLAPWTLISGLYRESRHDDDICINRESLQPQGLYSLRRYQLICIGIHSRCKPAMVVTLSKLCHGNSHTHRTTYFDG